MRPPTSSTPWIRQALKTSKRSRDYLFYLTGAAAVATVSMLFAKLADVSLHLNQLIFGAHP